MRTARAMGLRTVAVFTASDRDAPHVREADEALEVPGYLDIDAIVDAARRSGAGAIHPGYGFLSERSAFARAIEGTEAPPRRPGADVMDAMGKKDAAREIAVAAGVPVVPSYDLDADRTASPIPCWSRPRPVVAARACASSARAASTTPRWPPRAARR